MKNPGSAGLTVDRFGDSAKWTPGSDYEKDEHGRAHSYSMADVPLVRK